MSRSLLIVLVVAAVAGYGAGLAANAPKHPGGATITASNNIIINIGVSPASVTPESLRSIVLAATQGKE